MAARRINPQIRGELNPMEGNNNNNQKKKTVTDAAMNRRALGDIGNLVTIRGPSNPPVTRGFCAQLIAKAEAKAAAENKKPLDIVVAMIEKPKPKIVIDISSDTEEKLQKPSLIEKPKPKIVIDISSDTEEKSKKVDKKKHSHKKKLNSLTSVLTARSKAASKDAIIDIDASDIGNELAAVEYIEDIYKYYKQIESEIQVHDYIASQPELNQKMRSILIDWLIEVHRKFELLPETLYLTVNLVDRFLGVKLVPRRELQLVGISAMLMASKYEEIWAPEVNDFVCISDRACTHQQILKMEKTILEHLEWTLTVATPYVFLVRYIKASIADKDMEQMTHFLSELGMMNYNVSVMYRPSLISAAAVYAARCTLSKTPAWDATLELHTGFTESQLLDCAKVLVGFHSIAASVDNKLKAVYRKYSNPERGAVALLTPAKCLML